MTPEELLEHILGRLSRGEQPETFSAEEVRQWPDGAHAALVAAGVLQPMPPAQVLECDGCERNCFKSVHVRPRLGGQSTAAFIACDEPEDFGRIRVELWRLVQWRARGNVSPVAVASALGIPLPPETALAQPRHHLRDEDIRAKYAELAGKGKRNYVKEIQRTVTGADSLDARSIRRIVHGR